MTLSSSTALRSGPTADRAIARRPFPTPEFVMHPAGRLMRTVDIEEARALLPHLIERAELGEMIVISRNGRPIVTVVAVGSPPSRSRIGFMRGRIQVPQGLDDLGREEIESDFQVLGDTSAPRHRPGG